MSRNMGVTEELRLGYLTEAVSLSGYIHHFPLGVGKALDTGKQHSSRR